MDSPSHPSSPDGTNASTRSLRALAASFTAQCKWGNINKQALANKCVPLMNISYTKEVIDILLDCFN